MVPNITLIKSINLNILYNLKFINIVYLINYYNSLNLADQVQFTGQMVSINLNIGLFYLSGVKYIKNCFKTWRAFPLRERY